MSGKLKNSLDLSDLLALGEKRFRVPTIRQICEPVMLRGGGRGRLDDLETEQICALGKVVTEQAIKPSTLGIWIDQPKEVAEDHLELLEEGGFVQFDGTYYSPTELGEQVVEEIGEQIAKTDLMLLKSYMENLEKLANN